MFEPLPSGCEVNSQMREMRDGVNSLLELWSSVPKSDFDMSAFSTVSGKRSATNGYLLKKWPSTGPSPRRERNLEATFRISFASAVVNDSGGEGSRGTAGEGAEQGPEEGRILPEESVGNQKAEKEAVKQVRNFLL